MVLLPQSTGTHVSFGAVCANRNLRLLDVVRGQTSAHPVGGDWCHPKLLSKVYTYCKESTGFMPIQLKHLGTKFLAAYYG